MHIKGGEFVRQKWGVWLTKVGSLFYAVYEEVVPGYTIYNMWHTVKRKGERRWAFPCR